MNDGGGGRLSRKELDMAGRPVMASKNVDFFFDHPPMAPVAHSCIGLWRFVPVCQMVQYTSEPDDLAAR